MARKKRKKKINKIEQRNNKLFKLTNYIIKAAIVIFLLFGAFEISEGKIDYVFDRFASALLLMFFLFKYKKLHLKIPVMAFALFALILHHSGLYGTFPLGIPFDRVMHFVGFIALSMIIYQYLDYCDGKECRNRWKIISISLLAAMGIGAFIEIVEFVGYSFFGEGQGILFYGTGDFGEWNNVAWDLISNLFGSILGIITLLLFHKHKEKDMLKI